MKNSFLSLLFLLVVSVVTFSCAERKEGAHDDADNGNDNEQECVEQQQEEIEVIVVDANYTFEEALAGTKAPKSVIDELVLFDVRYISTDNIIHQGQIMCNRRIADDIRHMFNFMMNNGFMVQKVIPAVRYGWSDSLSMANNNSYSFNYRNITYSKHAQGMAIDINPMQNPLRWKNVDKPNQPLNAVLDSTVNGTLFPGHAVVDEFRRLGFRWGHTFSKYYDDHHFEK